MVVIGETRAITYQQLQHSVCRLANALKAAGVKKGDTVAIYMPMVPEAAIAMLACARIGAPHRFVCVLYKFSNFGVVSQRIKKLRVLC